MEPDYSSIDKMVNIIKAMKVNQSCVIKILSSIEDVIYFHLKNTGTSTSARSLTGAETNDINEAPTDNINEVPTDNINEAPSAQVLKPADIYYPDKPSKEEKKVKKIRKIVTMHCDKCNVDYNRTNHNQHLRSKKHLANV